MGFRILRVINEDRVAPGQGFGTHAHRDMEIVSYVLGGALEHKDSLGHGAVMRPGEVQRITAGTGVRHSEFNPSAAEPAHFYQIWLFPDRAGHSRGTTRRRSPRPAGDRWQTIVSPDGREGSLTIRQDAVLSLADVSAGGRVELPLAAGRYAWVQMLRGSANVNGVRLSAGDGAAVADEAALAVASDEGAEVLAFDLA